MCCVHCLLFVVAVAVAVGVCCLLPLSLAHTCYAAACWCCLCCVAALFLLLLLFLLNSYVKNLVQRVWGMANESYMSFQCISFSVCSPSPSVCALQCCHYFFPSNLAFLGIKSKILRCSAFLIAETALKCSCFCKSLKFSIFSFSSSFNLLKNAGNTGELPLRVCVCVCV